MRRVKPSQACAKQAAEWVAANLLHVGEAEALAHACEISADLFLTDDTAARVMAVSLGLKARGSLGVILYCSARGLLAQAEAEGYLDALARRSTLWLSSLVRREAKAALTEIYAI